MPSAAVSPADLAYALLGHDHWQGASDILDAVFRPRSRVVAKACHASSKTFSAADAIVLQLLRGGDVLTTAPTWEQVKSVLWGAVHHALYDAQRRGIDLAAWDINQTEIRTAAGAHALGLSTNEAVRFQGYHARPDSSLLVIFDEAPGVLPEIYEAVQGISAGGDVRWLLIGNPVIASGPFYDLFAASAPGWARFTIDAFETPNLAGLGLDALLELPEHELDADVRPYLVTRRWVKERFEEWGLEHPLWESRVRGRFPLQADDALISLAWLEEAGRTSRPFKPEHGPITAGLDIAGPGDDETCLWVVQGTSILEISAWAQADARGPVAERLRHWLHHGLGIVNVDSIGQGHYFAQHLKDVLPTSVTVRSVNVGEKPTTEKAAERYANLKAELYWALRERFREGDVVGLRDRTALAQLASLRYEHDSRGRIVIESKEKARKRGVKSPDRAEAGMLAFAPEDPRLAVRAAYREPPKARDGRAEMDELLAQRRRRWSGR